MEHLDQRYLRKGYFRIFGWTVVIFQLVRSTLEERVLLDTFNVLTYNTKVLVLRKLTFLLTAEKTDTATSLGAVIKKFIG